MSYVAFLRGINLGKINKVSMSSLKTLFEEMKFENVTTFIQTGNVLFENIVISEEEIEEKLKNYYGFDIPVTIRSKEEIEKIKNHPIFKKENVYILFLKNKISNEQICLLKEIVKDEFEIIENKTILINLSKTFHKSKYNNSFFEGKLHMSSTLRKSNTVEKILFKISWELLLIIVKIVFFYNINLLTKIRRYS